MRVHFSAGAWADYLHRTAADPAARRRLNILIADIARQPVTGLGKPETPIPARGRA